MKRPIILLVLLVAGCVGQLRQITFEEETAAVERFIGRYNIEGKRGFTIREGKMKLTLKSSLDADRSGKVTFYTTFTVGGSSIELPSGFWLERGRIKSAKATNISSIYRYLEDFNQIGESP